jgi:hypothetical protein
MAAAATWHGSHRLAGIITAAATHELATATLRAAARQVRSVPAGPGPLGAGGRGVCGANACGSDAGVAKASVRAPMILPAHRHVAAHMQAEEREPTGRPPHIRMAASAATSRHDAPCRNARDKFLHTLNTRIRHAATGDGVIAAIAHALEHNPSELDALALTAAVHRIAILHLQSRPRLARTDAARKGRADRHGADAASGGTIRGTAVRDARPMLKCGDGMELLHQQVVAKISSFEAHQCALTLWAVAKLSKTADAYKPPAVLVATLMRRAHETAGTARPRHVANTFWACATLGVRPEPGNVFTNCPFLFYFCIVWLTIQIYILGLLEALGRRVGSTLHKFGSQSIINILWALATLRLNPGHELAQALMERATAVVPQSSGMPSHCRVLFCSLLGLICPCSRSLLPLHLVSFDTLHTSAQGIANAVWALGMLELQPPRQLIAALGSRTGEVVHDFTPQDTILTIPRSTKFRIVNILGH